MDSNNLANSLKDMFSYFHKKQRQCCLRAIKLAKEGSTEASEQLLSEQLDMMYTEGAKDAIRMIAKEFELTIEQITFDQNLDIGVTNGF